MSFKVLTAAFLLLFIVSSVEAQVIHPAHLNNEAKWNPFDPKLAIDNPQGQGVVNEHEEQGSNSEQGITDAEDNPNSD